MDVQHFHEQHIVNEYHVRLDDFVHHVIGDEHQHSHVHDLDHILRIEKRNFIELFFLFANILGKQCNAGRSNRKISTRALLDGCT